jgi:EAL domain-containing protein (putative c-di-GMP-specific phosphodiesterase class I)
MVAIVPSSSAAGATRQSGWSDRVSVLTRIEATQAARVENAGYSLIRRISVCPLIVPSDVGRRNEVVTAGQVPDDTAGAPEGGASLTDVLGPGRIEPHFQAVIECATGTPRAVEALARWRTADGDVLEVESMLTLVEQFDVWALLDAELLRLAATQVATWRRLPGLRDLELHANLSPESLRDPALATRVARTCLDCGLDPVALWLEVTERSVIEDLHVAALALAEMRGLGIRIWIDDFGVGFASLSYIKRLPIDGVKIDRSFISDIETSDAGHAIVDAVVSIASRLALRVIAEGVENAGQAEAVRRIGVHATQGFYHGRPQPAGTTIAGFHGRRPATPRADFVPPPAMPDEEARLRVVAACSPPLGEHDPALDEVTHFLAEACDVQIAVIGVTDRYWTRYISQHGYDRAGHARSYSAIAQLLSGPAVSIVSDMTKDSRFAWHPTIRDGGMRFLAGELIVVDGQRVGAVIVVDSEPRQPTRRQLQHLHQAAGRAQAHLQLRYVTSRLRETQIALELVQP